MWVERRPARLSAGVAHTYTYTYTYMCMYMCEAIGRRGTKAAAGWPADEADGRSNGLGGLCGRGRELRRWRPESLDRRVGRATKCAR